MIPTPTCWCDPIAAGAVTPEGPAFRGTLRPCGEGKIPVGPSVVALEVPGLRLPAARLEALFDPRHLSIVLFVGVLRPWPQFAPSWPHVVLNGWIWALHGLHAGAPFCQGLRYHHCVELLRSPHQRPHFPFNGILDKIVISVLVLSGIVHILQGTE